MTVSRVVTIAVHEYMVNVRRIGFIVVTLLFPLIGGIAILVGGLFSGQATALLSSQFKPEEKQVGVVDQSRLFTPIPSAYAKEFVVFSDEETAKRALLSNEIGVYVVIPADYIATGKVTSYTKGGLDNLARLDSSDLDAFLVNGLLAGKVDPAYLKRASNPTNLSPVTLDDKGNPSKSGGFSVVAGFVAPYVFSLLLFVAVFSSSSYLLRSVADEKETRVIEIVLSSVSPTELLAGKVIGLGALGLTQVGIWLASTFALSGGLGAMVAGAVLVLNPGSFVLAVVYFVLGYVLFGTLMATAGALGSNPRESQQIAGIFSFTAAVPWFIAGALFANPNAPIARVLSVFPLTAPTTMMLRLPLGDVPPIDVAASLIVLLVSIPLALWGGARVFRIGLLMYGKRPSLSEIASALKSA
ncbi:MAG: ABC transporter permease [Chloroflexi bacterium]|nr:ABC transporter permease [Chloroflexota bacterium]